MVWSDVSYVQRNVSNIHKNKQNRSNIKIGLFGAYPKSVRNIQPLLLAIKELPQYEFIIVGDGDIPADYNITQNLTISAERLPLHEVEKLEADCDILLSLSSHQGIAPGGKTFYYASYPKPIIHIADGINGKYYNMYLASLGDRYLLCTNQKEEIKAQIEKAVNMLPRFELKIPERMNAAAIAEKILEL